MRPDDTNLIKAVRVLSEEWADKYQKWDLFQHEKGLEKDEQLLNDPEAGLGFLLKNGFARAGGQQAGYGDISIQAFKEAISECGSYHKLLLLSDPGTKIWGKFEQICRQKGKGPNEGMNKNVINGLAELAKESDSFNPFKRIVLKIGTGDVFGAYMLLHDIHGIGNKISAFILRDIVTIKKAEEKITFWDKIFLQPIDRWVGGIARELWKLPRSAPDWAIAVKVVEKCEKYGYSPLRFNQGAWKYGTQEIRSVKKIPKGLPELFR